MYRQRMAVKPSQTDNASAALDALDEIRLSRNWSYQQLAEDMERIGNGLPAKTLYQLLTARPENPYDRTMYQVHRYLAAIRDEKRVAS